MGAPTFPAALAGHAAGLRVVVVGTGPAAGCTASALLTTSASVTMVDRLEQPGGLVRFGVAPDHLDTRRIGERFTTVHRHPRVQRVLHTEVGRDVTHEQPLAHHDALVYAVGASADRTLGVPGEELRPLLVRADLDVVVDGGPEVATDVAGAAPGSKAAALRGVAVTPLDHTGPPPTRCRLVLRCRAVVEEVVGEDRVEAVHLAPAPDRWSSSEHHPAPAPDRWSSSERLETTLVLRSVGYRSEPVPGLPLDHATGTVPHREGRVVDPATGRTVPATYVVGWVKRGARGGIGANRPDAAETVGSVVDDANTRVISSGRGSARSFRRALRRSDDRRRNPAPAAPNP